MIVRLFFALLLAASWASPGLAFTLGDYHITRSLSHGNLSVHVLGRQSAATTPAPLTLQRASERGLARVQLEGKQIMASNLSDRSLLIEPGTVLRGATQDQVVWQSLILAPGARNVVLDTWCIESERWTAQPGASATDYTVLPAFAPLTALTRGRAELDPSSKVENRIRQLGIWLSINAMRSRLAGVLSAEGPLDNSLAGIMTSPAVERATGPFVAALAGAASEDAAGAVVVIGDRIAGIEAYGSPALFAEQWPRLLRAYAIEAMAAPASQNAAPGAAAGFLARAQRIDALAEAWQGPAPANSMRAVYRGMAGEPRDQMADIAATRLLVAERLRGLTRSTQDHPRILALLREVHAHTGGSAAAMRHAVREILAARALPSFEAMHQLVALGYVRPPMPTNPNLGTLMMLGLAGVLIILVMRRRRDQVRDRTWLAARTMAGTRRHVPSIPLRPPFALPVQGVAQFVATRKELIRALLREAMVAAARLGSGRTRSAVVPARPTQRAARMVAAE